MSRTIALVCAFLLFGCALPVQAEDAPGVNFLLNQTAKNNQPQHSKSAKKHIAQRESIANTLAVPNPILSTGCDITSPSLSPNALALADQLHITNELTVLWRDQRTVNSSSEIGDRLSYFETREHVSEVLRGAEMDINYVLAELYDEQATYSELLTSYQSERDLTIARTNALSFGTNGALWALCEGLAIPTAGHPTYAIPSGVVGVLAGIIPSVASALTLKQLSGKKHSEQAAPNMLSKLFGYQTSPELNYPSTVWNFLNSAPADNPKLRKDIIIDRWVMDSNISSLTDRLSRSQVSAVTGSSDGRKSLTLAVLSARIAMLQQLSSEVCKINRPLDELEMALRGLKHSDAALASAQHNSTE